MPKSLYGQAMSGKKLTIDQHCDITLNRVGQVLKDRLTLSIFNIESNNDVEERFKGIARYSR